MENKKLYRSRDNKMLFGVCGGLGEYFDIDPIIIRLFFIALTFAGGAGVVLYIIAAIIIPEEPSKKNNKTISEENESKESKEIKIKRRTSSELVFGLLFVFLGIGFLMQNFFDWFNFRNFWPFILIILGLAILINPRKGE